jgi:Zn-finger nucleic acid-binding protein
MKKFGDGTAGLIIDSCPKCWGIWFDAGEMKGLLQSEALKRQFLTDSRVKTAHTYSLSSGDRRCPRCRQTMERPVVGGITVDVCRTCAGVWLDSGELNQLVSEYKKKGLRGDDLVIEQIRDGLRSGNISESLWERMLAALRELTAKLFPEKS